MGSEKTAGRHVSKTVDYFPHKIGDGMKMGYIEKKYLNDGYATWWKVLERLAKSENHFINLNDEIQLMHLSSYCNISEEKLFLILNDLARLGQIDSILFQVNIVYSKRFCESIEKAYERRKTNLLTENELMQTLIELLPK